MKERPILMSAPMVRAILSGTKTQTRRVVKDRHLDAAPPVAFYQYLRENNPYGQPGDRLWVRENWKVVAHTAGHDNGLQESGGEDFEEGCAVVQYASDNALITYDELDPIGDDQAIRACKGRWKPSIHMPRWASRILLEIVSVRVERLQDISENDALAEGIGQYNNGTFGLDNPSECMGTKAIVAYMRLWESINGPGSWDANPWVWVIEFKRVKP